MLGLCLMCGALEKTPFKPLIVKKWWATLESNQARVAPGELQSPAAPCSSSPTLAAGIDDRSGGVKADFAEILGAGMRARRATPRQILTQFQLCCANRLVAQPPQATVQVEVGRPTSPKLPHGFKRPRAGRGLVCHIQYHRIRRDKVGAAVCSFSLTNRRNSRSESFLPLVQQSRGLGKVDRWIGSLKP